MKGLTTNESPFLGTPLRSYQQRNAYTYRIEILPYHGDGEPLPKNKPLAVTVYPDKRYAYTSTVYFHPQTGAFLGQLTFSDKTVAEKYNALSSDIHYGWLSKIIVFFACLIAASLPFTGFCIWWGRHGRNRRKPSRKDIDKLEGNQKGIGAMPTKRPIYPPLHANKPPII